MDKVYQLDVELILPGHGPVFENYKQRINEPRYHHEERLAEVLSLLEKRGTTAYETASRMSWEIAAEYDSWDRFPALQKCFATGGAIAHLKYLEEKRLIRRDTKRHRIVFSLKTSCPVESPL